MRIPIRLTLAGVATLLAALAWATASASADVGYANLCPSLQTALCTPDASFNQTAQGVAVDNSSGSSAGDVWVEEPMKLLKFDASGNLLAEVGAGSIPGSAMQIFGEERNSGNDAVDPTNGDVYVASPYPGVVTKFDSSGVFQFQISANEIPQGSFEPTSVAAASNGNVYVWDRLHSEIDEFTSAGKYTGQFAVSGGKHLAVGPEGNLYVEGTGQVTEYSAAGTPVDCPGGSNALHVEIVGGSQGPGMAVDPSNGHIFVGEASLAEGPFIGEYDSLCAGAPSARLGAKEFNVPGVGPAIGVDGATHEVYAGLFGEALNVFKEGRVLIFGVVTLPSVTTGTTATSITRSSAAVSGTVNPDETSVTTCEFEYGTTTAYGQSAICSQTLPLEGNSPTAVSAELKFSLPPVSLVHYRLKAGNANGPNVGEDHTFYTESIRPPIVGGQPATNVTQFAATLDSTIETFEGLVNYRFEYGTTTAYGSVAPIPDNYTPITTKTVPVSQPVGNLQAGTTYHYRLVASSPGATEVKGPDETFTTLPVPAPTVQTGAASGVGVGSATLPGTIDPHGWNTEYLFQYGTSTAYGSNWPSVEVEMGALEGPQPVVVGVPNLLPSTTYHYRLVASNGGGTTYGADGTFTTAEYPASIIQETPLIPLPKTTTTKTTTKTLTRAQKLAAALKACKKDKSKSKRAKCEKQAHKSYGPVKKQKKK
jgi:hypothetical protein